MKGRTRETWAELARKSSKNKASRAGWLLRAKRSWRGESVPNRPIKTGEITVRRADHDCRAGWCVTPWHAPGPCQVDRAYPRARGERVGRPPTMASSTSPISASRVSSRASIVGARRIPGARGASTSRACSRGGLITTEAIFGRGRKVESVKVEEQVEQEVEAPPAIEPKFPSPR